MTIQILPLTKDRMPEAFALATKVFIDASTLHRVLGVDVDIYREYLRAPFQQMIEQGLSVAAIDTATDKMVGCLILSDYVCQPSADVARFPTFLPLSALAGELDQQYRAKRTLAPGQAALVDMGAVSPDAGGSGIYQMLRSKAHKIAREKGFRWIIGELSSAATQHVILTRLGHKKMAEVRFDSFQINGRCPFRKITEPPSIILAEGPL
ncbi:hypothetical protein [Falsiphaeobacter marinintestinus]|uniref:hypothetical protein n=1 Tax=Falsiphaeobacter marinintestinus TaxID=1492905 RepID=UPI0011B69492|nr:hypothetical protein [Phaeobacter marinintestinus]